MALRTDFCFFDLVPELEPLVVVDVGAALTSKPPFYQSLLDNGRASVIGFEPDPKAFARLEARKHPLARYYKYALGDGGREILHHTTFRFTSSLYPPNHDLLRRFSNLPAFVQEAHREPIETHRLDDVLQNHEIDYLKIDVQGGELKVLQGAPRLLPTTLVAEIEVEFLPLYIGQPLFADIDTHMRKSGFQFHMFAGSGNFFYTPVQDTAQPLGGLNQLAYSNAIYIPAIDKADKLPRERLLKLVAILHEFYHSWDLCLHLLTHLATRGDSGPLDAYRAKLEGKAN